MWRSHFSSPHLAFGVVEDEFPVTAETLAEISDILVRRRGKCLVHVDELQGKWAEEDDVTVLELKTRFEHTYWFSDIKDVLFTTHC